MVLKARSEPQVPGAASDAAGDDPAQTSIVPAGNVTLTAEQFASLMSRVGALEGRAMNAQEQAASLPDAAAIDVATLTTPVLTKSGWLVPEKFGSNPAAKAL